MRGVPYNGVIIGSARYTDGVTDKVDRPADDDDTDFWLSVPSFRESLIEADADYAVDARGGLGQDPLSQEPAACLEDQRHS